MSSDIKVSVCVVTYNQERYIAECLQSLVDQVTDFPFEIIVGEDCSTDETRKVVESFAQRYPDLIVRNYHDKNVGAVQNAITSYRMAKGKYICHMDGDDGALPNKLKKAAGLLDDRDELVMVTHDMIVVNKESLKESDSLKKYSEGVYSIEGLIFNFPFFANSAKMVRREACINSLGQLTDNAIDVELHVLEARFGSIFHIDSPLGYYRAMVGISSSQNRVNPLIVDGYHRVFNGLIEKSLADIEIASNDLKKMYAKAMLNFAYQSVFFGNCGDAIKYSLKSLNIKFFSMKQLVVLVLSFLGPLAKKMAFLRYKLKNM